MKIRRCVFFDRDGIVNEPPDPGGYVTRWQDFRVMPGFIESLRVVARRGYHGAIVTNQRAVAKGLIAAGELEDMHGRLKRLLARNHRLRLLDIAYCPHHPGECKCRKPQPGLLLDMARKHDLDLGSSWMIGDAETDIEAGRLAGCRTILVGAGDAPSEAHIQVSSVSDLPAVLDAVL